MGPNVAQIRRVWTSDAEAERRAPGLPPPRRWPRGAARSSRGAALGEARPRRVVDPEGGARARRGAPRRRAPGGRRGDGAAPGRALPCTRDAPAARREARDCVGHPRRLRSQHAAQRRARVAAPLGPQGALPRGGPSRLVPSRRGAPSDPTGPGSVARPARGTRCLSTAPIASLWKAWILPTMTLSKLVCGSSEGVDCAVGGASLGRTFDAIRQAEMARAEKSAAREEPRAASPARAPEPARVPTLVAALRRWRGRRRAREAARRARRTENAARQAAIVSRLDRLDLRIASLEEAVTKQLAELEPRLLHVFELRSAGLERELANLAPRVEREPGRNEPPIPVRAISLALIGWFGLLTLRLGVWFAKGCAG